jgi:hypothetical protein
MVPVDLSGAPVVDLSGARTLTSDPEDAKALKVCEVEASEKCKGCDCSVDTSKETRGLKLLVPASA